MKQRRSSNRPATKTCRVFRGGASAVTERVSRETGDGLLLPCGPFRYPYSAIVELLRQARLFIEPTGDTATDPVLCREGLTPALRKLVTQNIRIGVPQIECLDSASLALLRDVVKLAEFRQRHELPAPTVSIGSLADTDASEFAAVPEAIEGSAGESTPVHESLEILRILASAPHPPREAELRKAARVSWDEFGYALRELVATGHVMVGERVGLGPRATEVVPTDGREWLDTAEVRLPHARLGAVQSLEKELGIRLGASAAERGDARGAAGCFETCGALDHPEYALALARLGKREAARAILKVCEDVPPVVAAEAALLGACESGLAETSLRRYEKSADKVQGRALRACLMLRRGEHDKARNLLRRTTRAMLEESSAATQLLHWMTLARCAVRRRDFSGVTRGLDAAQQLLRRRNDHRAWLELAEQAHADDPAPNEFGDRLLEMALTELDADEFTKRAARFHQEDVRQYLEAMSRPGDSTDSPPAFTSVEQTWEWLSKQGATLLAIRVGERCAIHPPGGAARPGLQARLDAMLARIEANPDAVLHSNDDFEDTGPFGGDIVLTLRNLGEFGPAVVLFRKGRGTEARAVLKLLNRS